jgi:hypothetical protein
MRNPLRDVRAGGAIAAGSTSSELLSLRRMAGRLIAGIEAVFSETPSSVRDADKFTSSARCSASWFCMVVAFEVWLLTAEPVSDRQPGGKNLLENRWSRF